MSTIPLSPKLIQEWHPKLNKLDVDDVTPGSNHIVWWLGPCGHEWEAKINHRTRGSGCPYCKGVKVLKGFNDLLTLHPLIASEWDYSANHPALPENVTAGSAKKVSWVCNQGHKWYATVKSRTVSKTNCSVCSNHRFSEGVNDFATLFPELTREWDEKNSITSNTVKSTSSYLATWVCPEGHKYEMKVLNRASGRGCPRCGYKKAAEKKRAVKPSNSVSDFSPEISKQWSPGNVLSPDEVNSGSSLKVLWVCDKGHTTLARVMDKVRRKTQCGKCNAESHSSQKERDLQELIKSLIYEQKLELITNSRDVLPGNFELDVYVPEKKIAFEFNGVYWHSESAGKGREYHFRKYQASKRLGIELVQIWEDDWDFKRPIVTRIIEDKLGVSFSDKVHGGKTHVVEVSARESKKFLLENHIQGNTEGSIRHGLMIDGKLVALIVLSKEESDSNETLSLLRFATSTHVIGGFAKLLSYIQTIYSPRFIHAFSDNCVSSGELYSGNGFEVTKLLEPDYLYLRDSIRECNLNYSIPRFKEDVSLKYEEGKTAHELALMNGFHKVWDAGKVRWTLSL